MQKLGLPIANKKIQLSLFKEMDSQTKDEKIELQEFIDFLEKRSQEFEKAYKTITNRHHHLTAKHLRIFFKKIGIEASDEQIREFIEKIDHNQDGKVTFDDF